MVEIARAVASPCPASIIFDEPTATLTPEEKFHFFAPGAPAEGRGHRDHLHQPRAGGGAAALRPHHRSCATARCVGDRRHRKLSTATASSRRWSGAACRANSTAAARKARPLGPQDALGARISRWAMRCATPRSRSSPARSPACSGSIGAGRTETMKIVAGVLKRDYFHGGTVALRGQAGALPHAAAGGARRHRLCHRGPQDRRLLRDDDDRRATIQLGHAREGASTRCT